MIVRAIAKMRRVACFEIVRSYALGATVNTTSLITVESMVVTVPMWTDYGRYTVDGK
jgi:hypothetical protein